MNRKIIVVGKEAYGLERSVEREEAMKEIPKTTKKLKCLDVGCGIGNYTTVLKKLGYDVYGIDINRKALKTCKKRKLNVKFCDLDRSINYPNNSFSVVYCSEVIEHVKCPKKLIDNIYGVLKPGGYLIMTTPNSFNIEYTMKRKLLNKSHNQIQNPTHKHFFDINTFLGLFDANWKIISLFGIFPTRGYGKIPYIKTYNKKTISLFSRSFIIKVQKHEN